MTFMQYHINVAKQRHDDVALTLMRNCLNVTFIAPWLFYLRQYLFLDISLLLHLYLFPFAYKL